MGKRLLGFILVIAVLLLSSCGQKENKYFKLKGEFQTSKTLKIVTKESFEQDCTVIDYYISNVGFKEHSIAGDDNCFELHKLVDGEWKRVGTKNDHEWTLVALILEPHQTEERQIKLEDYFHLPLESGEYRIAVGTYLSNTFTIS